MPQRFAVLSSFVLFWRKVTGKILAQEFYLIF